EVRLVLEDRVPLIDAESRAQLELVVLSNQAFVEAQLGRPMYEGRFEFPYPAPEYLYRYRDLFHAPLRFGCPEAAIVIPASWLSVESRFADPNVFNGALGSLGPARVDSTETACSSLAWSGCWHNEVPGSGSAKWHAYSACPIVPSPAASETRARIPRRSSTTA